MRPASEAAFPGKRRFNLLEDNDPSGHKSGLGEAAKRSARISCVPFPKHSPDLMPLDYGFWQAVNKRLRKQELSFAFAGGYYETRKHFVARLRRTVQWLNDNKWQQALRLCTNQKKRAKEVQELLGAKSSW